MARRTVLWQAGAGAANYFAKFSELPCGFRFSSEEVPFMERKRSTFSGRGVGWGVRRRGAVKERLELVRGT